MSVQPYKAEVFLQRYAYLAGSSICFLLAAYQYPAALRSMWGHMVNEMPEGAWSELKAHGYSNGGRDFGLGLLVTMTRSHDLGLQELLFGDKDLSMLEPSNADS